MSAPVDALARLALLDALVDSSGDAIFVKDSEGRYLLFNREAERVTGKAREQVLGRDDHALFPPEQAEMLMALGRRVMQERRAFTEEERLATVDGERVFLATKQPLLDATGAATGVIGISRDITERRRAQSALQRERELLAEVSAIAHLGGWSFDPATGEGSWTEEVARIHDLDPGVKPSAAMGLDFFRGESRTRIEAAIAAACSEGRPFDLELELLSATGHLRWVRSVGLAETDGGRVRRVRGFMQDISAQRLLVQELERHRHKLEELVRERTEQLHEARDRAEAANRAKSLFLANMSHEMRTPLHAIAGLSALLRRTPLDACQQDHLGKLENASQHLLDLVSDVLDLSKVEAGRLTFECEDFELGALLLQVRDAVLADAGTKGLALRLEGPSEPLWLRGDPMRLRQALLNYASNAVKFTPAGSVQMRLHHAPAATGGVALHFEVCDTGIGIAAQHLPRLFERFEQGDMSTTRRFGGSGLGLAITRQLVELMGGSVGAESEPDRGSRFWLKLTLPRATPAAPADAPPPRPDLEATIRRRHAGRRILLVEDNPVNREVATCLLRSAGLSVAIAADGIEAVAAARLDPPAMILMDLQMPRMDGLAATRAIRALGAAARLPILAMTANVTSETLEACTAAGMDGFIGKPFEAAQLHEALLRWLPGHRLSAARAEPAVVSRPRPLLELFGRTHADDVACIATLLAVADWDGLARLAHALRGSSGSIGATAVMQASAALEAALRSKASDRSAHEALAVDLQQSLQRCLEELKIEAGSSPAMTRQAGVAPPADCTPLIEHLASLLDAGDVDSAAWLAEHRAALQQRLGARCVRLAELIESFRFDEALRLLRDDGGA